ncbi:MAG TPA: hypothetical protein DIU39_03810, partial [Flavobacteriales bacterium]|nr:hypothetical protein [Flavobacteriales bacterium]
AIVGVVSVIAGVLFSSPIFIRPRYKTEAVLYPMNLTPYSNESATEQMLQLLESNEITNALISDFDLYKKYEIDPAENGSRFKILKEIKDNIQITKTSYESVVVEVTDYSAEDAKAMVDSIISKVNKIAKRIEHAKAKAELEALEIIKKQKGQTIKNLLDSIKLYSIRYDLLDYIMQSKEVTAGYMELLARNVRGKSYEEAMGLYKNLEKQGRKFHDFHHQLNLTREEYAQLEKEYDEALKKMKQDYTFTNVIVSPEVPDKKAYPIRWLIVVLVFVSSEIMLMALLMFKHKN